MDVGDIEKQLSEGQLSRRGLVERLAGVGIGFGVAFVLGVAGAQAATAPEAGVVLKSTNPALNSIIQQGPQTPAADAITPLEKTAYYYYRRYYHRYYMRHYGRY